MEVIRYDDKHLDQWENFVASSNNGTIFHTRRFLSYHPHERFNDCSLIFREGNTVLGVLTACLIESNGTVTLVSHKGASFGGFVYRKDLSLKQAFDLTESLLQFCSKNKFSRIVITQSPVIYQRTYNNYIDFAFMRNGFMYLKREVSSISALDVPENEVLTLFKPETRTAVRKAEKSGVQVRISEDYDRYYDILKNNLSLRHNVNPAHSLEEIRELHRLFPDKIYLLGAYLDDKLIAGIINFECNELASLLFYISHDQEYQSYRAVNLLFYDIMKRSITRKFKYLDFGLFTVNMEPNWGLGRFKENFGARGMLRDTFYLDL